MTEQQEQLLSGISEFPYHISVGAVLLNDKNEVCVHHFDSATLEGKTAKYFYILMRETPEPDEAIIETLHRGLFEEFGATASVMHYIGPLVCEVDYKHLKEKTTLYFLCRLIDQDINDRAKDDAESNSVIEWHNIDFLIEKMQIQGRETGFADIDESKILQRTKQLLSNL
jgi:hypothetical protein